jgi:uncharacterized protein (UPF0335 family)
MSDEINAGHLRAFIERIERLNEEKKELSEDIKEVYAEAKGNGFDPKIIREIVKIRKQDADARREHEAILEIYLKALGMLADTPLGQAAAERAVAETRAPKGRPKVGFKAKVSAEVHKAVGKLGKPVPLTEKEKAQGVKAAFEGRDGIRMSIVTGVPVGAA